MVSNNHDLSSVKRLWILLRFWKREPGHREPAKPARRHAGVPLPIDLDALEEAMNRRLRMIWVRHTTLLSLFAFIVVVGLVVLAVFLTTKATVMRIAVGPAGSRDVQFVEKLAERFRNDHASIRLQPVVKNSPVDVKDIHGKPEFDLAVARGNMSLSTDWPVVAILRQNVVALIVPAPGAREMPKNKKGKTVKPPKIEQVSDLAGRRVGIVAGSDGGAELLDVILKHYGVATDKVQAISVEPSALKQAIRDNKIDAVLVAGPATGEAIAQAVLAASHGKDGPTFIEIDQAEGIGKRVPPYDSTEIVAGTFGGVPPMPADNLTTLSYPIYLVARKTLSEDKIAAFSKLLYTSRQSLAYGLPGAVAIESPSTDKDAPVLVHPGAAAYLGDNQKSFFDRYGDQIFYGLLIFPVIGSALAGFASYFRADKNTQRIRQLHRLLQLVKRARSVQSVEELDQLQDEADHILGLTIQQAERGQLDETGLAVFTLAIEQARLALSEQRSMLVLRPENVPAHRVASHTPQRAATG
ncbi:MAG TPA: TAXI family TRAP transporter solute-binding subunit [Xanthobacteraceae bacterium]